MKNKKAYKFALWKRDVLKNLHSPLNPEPTESDFPTIDFERIYFMMPNPIEAAEVVRAVHAFTKDEYKDPEKRKALMLPPTKA